MDFDLPAIEHLDSGAATSPAFFVFLDILGDPVRASTAGYDVSFTAGQTGDPDLDGHTFGGIDPRVVNIGELTNSRGGSDTLECSLSGLLLPDNDLLNTVANKANWRGRVARFWVQIRDENNVWRGKIAHYHTGYMWSLEIEPSPERQIITLKTENYLSFLKRASGRTYLSQNIFDPNDQSARATIGAANGAKGPASGVNYGGSYSGGGFGGRDSFIDRVAAL